MTIPDLNREKRKILKLVLAASRREPFDQQAYDDHMAEVDRIGEAIDEATEERDYIESRRVPGGVLDGGDASGGADYATTAPGVTGVEAVRATSLFSDRERFNMTDNGGFANFSEFVASVSSGRHDPRLYDLQQRAMSEGIPSAGGFAVPTQYIGAFLDSSLESEIVRPRARIVPMSSDEAKTPAFDGSDHSSTRFGGLLARWGSEGGSLTESTPKLREITLNARKLYIYTVTSNEVAADGQQLGSQLTEAMASEAGFVWDDAMLNGDGAGKPLGALNAANPSLIVQAKEAGQAATTVVYENCLKMMSRMPAKNFLNSVWVAHVSTIPQLMTQSVTVGTGGSTVPMLQEKSGKFSMLTRPVIFSEKMAQLGTQGDIALCDFSQYVIGLRQDVQLATSEHIKFDEDRLAFRVTLRVAGQSSWNNAITPKNGTDTLSPFVTLAVRS